MLYMIVEHFHEGDPLPVYRRLREGGRGLPAGLQYVSSWVTADMSRCYQVMETDQRELIDEWTGYWSDLVEFEVIPVITSNEARAIAEPSLHGDGV